MPPSTTSGGGTRTSPEDAHPGGFASSANPPTAGPGAGGQRAGAHRVHLVSADGRVPVSWTWV